VTPATAEQLRAAEDPNRIAKRYGKQIQALYVRLKQRQG